MNQLSKLIQQAQALFAGMTPQSRVLAILLSAAIALSAGFLVQGYRSSGGSMELLFDGQSFEDGELDRMEMAFSTAKLKGWVRNGKRISVPTANRDEYLRAISVGKAFPNMLGGEMAEVLSGNSFLESVRTTEMKMKDGKLRALANALKRLPNVQEALVDFDEGKEGFASVREKRAIVCIVPSGTAVLSEDVKRNILSLVKNAISGLKESNISVMDLRTGETLVGSDDPAIHHQNRYNKEKMVQEQMLYQKAQTLLSDYGNVKIAVTVELDNTLTEETQNLKIDDKPTVVQSQTTRKDADSQKAANGGRPGVVQSLSGTTNQSASLDQMTKSKESTETQRNVAGNTLTRTEKAGLQIKGSSISVSVPFSYYRKLWLLANPTKSPDDMPPYNSQDWTAYRSETEKSIQNKLIPILHRGLPGDNDFPRVFVDYYVEMPSEKQPALGTVEVATNWLMHSWQTLGLFGLAFTALISLRSFVRSGPTGNDGAFERGFDLPLDDADDIDLDSLSAEDEPALDDEGVGEAGEAIRLRTTGGDLKKDLTSIVRENPEAAATLLRNWISSGN